MEELKVVCMRKAKIKDTEAHQGETTTSVTLHKTHRLKICTLGSESSSCKNEWISRDLIGQCFCLYWSLILNIAGPGAEQVCRIGYHGDVPWIKPEVASISPKPWAHTDLCSDISVHSADDTDQSGLSRLWVHAGKLSVCRAKLLFRFQTSAAETGRWKQDLKTVQRHQTSWWVSRNKRCERWVCLNYFTFTMRHKGGGDTPLDCRWRWTVSQTVGTLWAVFTDLFTQTGESRESRKQEDETEKDRRTRRLHVQPPAAQKHWSIVLNPPAQQQIWKLKYSSI